MTARRLADQEKEQLVREQARRHEAERANEMKDAFLATLSHELRTPLNAIVGWTQLLQMEKPQGEMAHGLEVIDRNARAQTKLIEDLLDVSRISSGKLRLNMKVVSLASVIDAAVESSRPAAGARGVELKIDLPPESQRVVADPDRLQQVVWNLLSNAVKFTPAGGVVSVDASQVGAQVQIRVSDTGMGIEPTFVPYVFDRFRQADSTSTRAHGGLGIGLAIVRHIVELHGGNVGLKARAKEKALSSRSPSPSPPPPSAITVTHAITARAMAKPESI